MDNTILIAACILPLKDLESGILAAAYHALTGWGVVRRANIAFAPLYHAMLITEQGTPTFDRDVLERALHYVIVTRMEAGTLHSAPGSRRAGLRR